MTSEYLNYEGNDDVEDLDSEDTESRLIQQTQRIAKVTFNSARKSKTFLTTEVFFFVGRGFQALFAIWSISSHVGVQIGLELVRLIALICLNKFWTNVTSPKSRKKFSRTTFR